MVVYFPVLRPVMARATRSAGFIWGCWRGLGCFVGILRGVLRLEVFPEVLMQENLGSRVALIGTRWAPGFR